MRLLLALTLLTGCGAPIVDRCYYGPIEVLSEVPLDCLAVEEAGSVLEAMYRKPLREALALDPDTGYSFEQPWPEVSPAARWGGFDGAFRGYTVVIQDVESVTCNGKLVAGCHDGSTTYMPARTQRAFAHESLHFLECRAGDCHNVDHLGWAENGYTSFGTAYSFSGPQRSWAR